MHAEGRREVAAGGVATGAVSTESDGKRVSEGPRRAPLTLAGLLARVLRDRLGGSPRGGGDPGRLPGGGDRVAISGGGPLGATDVAEVQVVGEDLQQPRGHVGAGAHVAGLFLDPD